MRKRTQKDTLLDVAKKMPPLYHKFPGEDFDWLESETVRWLVGQPEILNYIWESVKGRSENKRLIRYDPHTGKWQGVDFDGD